MSPEQTPEPTELIYVPSSSWSAVICAAGIAFIAAAAWMGWVMAAIGVILLLLGARSWWTTSGDEISRMRRHQRTDTAVIPAEPVRLHDR